MQSEIFSKFHVFHALGSSFLLKDWRSLESKVPSTHPPMKPFGPAPHGSAHGGGCAGARCAGRRVAMKTTHQKRESISVGMINIHLAFYEENKGVRSRLILSSLDDIPMKWLTCILSCLGLNIQMDAKLFHAVRYSVDHPALTMKLCHVHGLLLGKHCSAMNQALMSRLVAIVLHGG